MSLLLVTLLISLGGMVLLWLVSFFKRDASVVDAYWGPGFVVLAWSAFFLGDPSSERGLLIATLVTLWGLRLGVHLFLRWAGHPGEDARYARMRDEAGPSFTYTSLVTVFLLQGLIMWIVSLPIQIGQFGPDGDGITPIQIVGLLVFALGLSMEVISDWQLARFKAQAGNEDRVMTNGLWAWSRHPNYFGEMVLWWGLYLVALGNPAAWWTIISPLLLSMLIYFVSGKAMLERLMLETKPDYAAYVANTSGFFPLPPGFLTGRP